MAVFLFFIYLFSFFLFFFGRRHFRWKMTFPEEDDISGEDFLLLQILGRLLSPLVEQHFDPLKPPNLVMKSFGECECEFAGRRTNGRTDGPQPVF